MMWRKKKTEEHYAGFNRRMWAATVDSLLVTILLTPVFDWLSGQEVAIDLNAVQRKMEAAANSQQANYVLWRALVDSGQLAQWGFSMAWQTLALCLIVAVCWKLWSSTPGKMLFRMKVVDAGTEAPISNRQILLRLAGYFVSTLMLFIGFFWIGFDKRRQGWHDKIAGTVVVIKSKKD